MSARDCSPASRQAEIFRLDSPVEEFSYQREFEKASFSP